MGDDAGQIVISGLTKRFGGVTAVDGLTFSVAPGSVTGFLGPNGAGKTTTLRMLAGLVAPDAGTATISGRTYAGLGSPGRKAGVVLEAAGFHPARTGRNHLRVYCTACGYPPRRADEVLEICGLAAAGRQNVSGYSLGMRQRLALEKLGVPLAAGQALAGIAGCDEAAGDAAAARAVYQRLVTIGETAGEIGLLAAGLEGLARASMADSDAYQAATLLGRATWLRATYDRPRAPGEQAAAGRAEATARAALGDHRYDAAARQGAEIGIGTPS